jgi:hypothetical protein
VRNQSRRAEIDARARKLRDGLGDELADLAAALADFAATDDAAELTNELLARTLHDITHVVADYRKMEVA